jgi:hypothetical protein
MSVRISNRIAGYFGGKSSNDILVAFDHNLRRNCQKINGGGGNNHLTNNLRYISCVFAPVSLLKYFHFLNIIAVHKFLYCATAFILFYYPDVKLKFLLSCYNMHYLKIC